MKEYRKDCTELQRPMYFEKSENEGTQERMSGRKKMMQWCKFGETWRENIREDWREEIVKSRGGECIRRGAEEEY